MTQNSDPLPLTPDPSPAGRGEPADAAASDFAPRLIAWQRHHGRHDLPWQVDANTGADAYRVWLSEIMLQQTQVETVIPYYRRFLDRFPDLPSLAAADLDTVLALWSGLGYYARARNLHAAARRVIECHGGCFPAAFDDILALPGIGRSTAAAIAAFTRGEQRAILDGNVKRVLCRVFGVEGWPGDRAVEGRLWELAEALLPEADIQAYTQGLMDLGATVCRRARPDCPACPLADLCLAHRQGRQNELPAARPRKDLPQRRTAMLVYLHAGEVRLERRPATGLWGGLWSLPECAMEADARQVAGLRGWEIESVRDLPTLDHAFSHFRLRIHPRLVSLRRRAHAADEPGQLWLPLADALEAALPTPVRKILAGLC